MDSAGAFTQEMLVLYCIALLGFIVRKTGILNENANDVLTQLLLYITLPALILFSLDISFSYILISNFIWLTSMSCFILTLSCYLAWWMRKRSNLPKKQKSVYEALVIFGNQGFIGYAVSFILFGKQGIVYLTMFNLCYLLLIWTYGVYLFTRNKNTIKWSSIFLNPGILSTITGLIILFTPITLPDMLSKTLESVGKMTIPLSMMMIGILIANVNHKKIILSLRNWYLWKSALAKLLIIPLLLLPFAVFSVPLPLLTIAVIVSGMPSAPTISLYSQKYGADTFFASLGVLITTFLCIFTIPLLYFLLNLLYGLN
jgi:malate permease and related proteins